MLGYSKHEILLPGKGHSPVILTEISNKANFLRKKSIPHGFSLFEKIFKKSLE